LAILFDVNPHTRVVKKLDYDESTDKYTMQTTQDVSHILDKCKALRNETDYSKIGIKKDMWHYCTIPEEVIVELRNKGIDIYRREDHPRMFAEINSNYPHLKCTDLTHG
jgi:hypothetical protein